MDIFICTNVFIPLRSSPAHSSEMISQILFGERFQIAEASGNWLRVETYFDSYKGWIDSSHGGYIRFDEAENAIITGREMTCLREDGSLITLAPGSELYNLKENFSSFMTGGERYTMQGADAELFSPSAMLTGTAIQFLNAPYLWGGRTPLGIDCSGLVQVVCKIHGIALPRDASCQAEIGITVNFFSEAHPGDLLFFSDEKEKISHTGMLLSPGKIIHASGIVRIDKVDHQGIWRDDLEKYTHRLRIIKNVQL